MRIKDMVVFLQSLDQEADILFASYYYDVREDFQVVDFDLSKYICRPSESKYNSQYTGNVYLFDLEQAP